MKIEDYRSIKILPPPRADLAAATFPLTVLFLITIVFCTSLKMPPPENLADSIGGIAVERAVGIYGNGTLVISRGFECNGDFASTIRGERELWPGRWYARISTWLGRH